MDSKPSGKNVQRSPRYSALLTDLYELTMAAAYFENGIDTEATFELFVRNLPPERGFLLAAGLEQALDFLQNLAFTSEDIDFLRRHPVFSHVSPAFFDSLRRVHFTGEVWALPEGTPVFAEEPLVRITAPIIEAQIVETFLLNAITFQTLIATKAARVAGAAGERGVVEFGTRRAHGPESGVLAARAAYVGGCLGTSNVEAGRRFGLPTYGTVAHSFVMAFEDEAESFQQFQRVFPKHSILLIDTYDALAAVDKIISRGLKPMGVRLDSGDLVGLSREVRRRLDQAGWHDTKIFASGDLNEYLITEALRQGAPVDIFGVGTELATSKDAPALSGVYKLVELLGPDGPRSRAKLSQDKVTYPGRKQVFRLSNAAGLYDSDVIALANEHLPEGEPLLQCVMRGGQRAVPSPSLAEIRERAQQKLRKLPAPYRRLRNPAPYPVRRSAALERLLEEVRQHALAPLAKKFSS